MKMSLFLLFFQTFLLTNSKLCRIVDSSVLDTCHPRVTSFFRYHFIENLISLSVIRKRRRFLTNTHKLQTETIRPLPPLSTKIQMTTLRKKMHIVPMRIRKSQYYLFLQYFCFIAVAFSKKVTSPSTRVSFFWIRKRENLEKKTLKSVSMIFFLQIFPKSRNERTTKSVTT